MKQSPEETRHKLPRVISQQSYRMGLISPAMNWIIHEKSAKKLKYRLSSQSFYWGYLHEHHLLPRTYQNSRLSEGKQVFSINHIVQTGQAQ